MSGFIAAAVATAVIGAGTAIYTQSKAESAAKKAAAQSEANRRAAQARAEAEAQRLADLQEARNKAAAKKAQDKADADAARARRAQVFSETIGEGQGEVGEITLDIDDEIDEEEESARQGLRV